MSFPCTWCARLFKFLGGHSNHENTCISHILLDSSPVPSSLKNLLPFRVAGKITTVVTTRSASNRIREGSTTVSGQEAASREAIDTAKAVGSLQDIGESEADESKSVDSPPLKRRRSQRVMNISARKAKITVHEESDDPGIECSLGGIDGDDNICNGDDATVGSEELPDPEESDSYDGAFDDEEEVFPEDDPDEDGGLMEEVEVVLVEDDVIVPSMEDDIDYNDHKYLVNELDSYHQERRQRKKIPRNMEAAVVLLSDLRKSNVSLEAYKKIMKWTDQYFIFNGTDDSKPPSRACVIKYLSKRYKLDCLKPRKTRCCLPTTNLVFDLITHRLLSSIFSLFTDQSLMKPENLIYKNARKPCKLS